MVVKKKVLDVGFWMDYERSLEDLRSVTRSLIK